MLKAIRRLLIVIILLIGCICGYMLKQGADEFEYRANQIELKQVVEKYQSKKQYVAYEDLDEDFVYAVISVEDKRFFSHWGIDVISLMRAIISNLSNGAIQEGGSTITQQVAKNVYFTDTDSSIVRKFAEIWAVLAIEDAYDKEEIFALYVNMNYYGDGYWGIQKAAKGYCNASAKDLTLAQASLLAGLPQAPAVYQLSSGYELAKARQLAVLQSMVNNGYITQEEAEQAYREDIK